VTSDRSQWTLRRRVRALFTLAAAVAAVTMGIGVAAFVNLLDAREAVIDRLAPALVATDDYLVGLLTQQNALRGVLLSGSPDFVDNYTEGVEQGAVAVERLHRLLRDEPAILERLDAIVAQSEAWQRDYAAAELDASEAGQPVAPAVVESSRAVFEEMRIDLEALKDEIGLQRGAARTDLNDATKNLIVALTGAVVALLAIAVVIRIALRRWVLDPIEHLGEETEQVREGRLSRPIAALGPPEIHRLGTTVEAMRDRIQRDLAEVEEARIQLADAAEELTRSNRDLEQFAYVASHDLQEPLRKVTSFCQLLQQRYGGQLDERADQYIEFAVDGAKRMQALINDLLAFSRVGRLSGEFEEVDLARPAKRALDNLSERIEETGATVEVGELPTVCGEPNLLAAVFQNLIGNALKFRRADEPPLVRVTAIEGPESWEIAVADNGIGIAPEYAERVFVIFQRLHTKDAYTGTGIGLALCRRIIEHHDGHIWVDPAVASGTTIRFTLPKPASATAATDAAPPTELPDPHDTPHALEGNPT
jgi:signal transduction histidine kinase